MSRNFLHTHNLNFDKLQNSRVLSTWTSENHHSVAPYLPAIPYVESRLISFRRETIPFLTSSFCTCRSLSVVLPITTSSQPCLPWMVEARTSTAIAASSALYAPVPWTSFNSQRLLSRMGMALSRERFVHLQLQLLLVALFPSAFPPVHQQSLLQKAATVWQGQNRSRYPTSWSAPTLICRSFAATGGSRRSQYTVPFALVLASRI
ncbi:hypothetical protein QBC32DRAFT_29078, partial [Pseudoneurospora amorphoporcata]